MNEDQANTIFKLWELLQEATTNGTLDRVACYVHPNVINNFCVAIEESLADTKP